MGKSFKRIKKKSIIIKEYKEKACIPFKNSDSNYFDKIANLYLANFFILEGIVQLKKKNYFKCVKCSF